MHKLNCWKFKKCGREPGGNKVGSLGVCPAALVTKANNINNGKNGGRSCWVITGTLCKGEVQGVYALKFCDCSKCDFYKKVQEEEGQSYEFSGDILKILEG